MKREWMAYGSWFSLLSHWRFRWWWSASTASHSVVLFNVLSSVVVRSFNWKITLLDIIDYDIKHTFDLVALIIQTHSQTPTKYRPRFPLLCSPDTGQNPITSALNFHFPSFTLIQWAVTLRNDAFVVSTDQLSAVIEIKPRLASNVSKISSLIFNTKIFNLPQLQCLYLAAIG
jgi:hypothetical protein